MINTAKRLSALAFALVMIFSSLTVCFAATEKNNKYSIDDIAEVFTEQDFNEIKTKLETSSNKTGWQFIVYTDTNSVSASSLRDYYETNYFEKNGFEKNSVVLVINSTMNRGTFFANGGAAYYINDSRTDETGKKLRKDMDNQDYVGAVNDFADQMVKYHDNPTAEAEKKSNKLGYVLKHFWWAFALIAIVAGGATFGITAGKYKYNGKFNTYDLKANSQTMLTDSQDVFVTKHTTSHTIQSSSSSSSGSSRSSGAGGSRGGDF